MDAAAGGRLSKVGDGRKAAQARLFELALGGLVVMAAIGSGWIVSDFWASIGAPAVSPEPARPRNRPPSWRSRRIVPASLDVARVARRV